MLGELYADFICLISFRLPLFLPSLLFGYLSSFQFFGLFFHSFFRSYLYNDFFHEIKDVLFFGYVTTLKTRLNRLNILGRWSCDQQKDPQSVGSNQGGLGALVSNTAQAFIFYLDNFPTDRSQPGGTNRETIHARCCTGCQENEGTALNTQPK